jgi:hypothetical protein
MVVVPAVHGISPESFYFDSFRPGNTVYLRPDVVERFEFVNKIAQAIPPVALFPAPGGQDFEFVEFMADDV